MNKDIDWDATIAIVVLLVLNIVQAAGHPFRFVPH